jgi:Beta-galactosidase
MERKKFQRILFGGDYNPNQWGKDIWKEDMRIFKKAFINSATINVFSWAKLQPEENRYDFTELDEIMEMLEKENYEVVLATATAAMPAWMYAQYPEIARTDFEGRQHKFGQRHNFCPNSLVYQKYAKRLVTNLAQRYHLHPNLSCWHVNNEYGGECFCKNCEREFRVWLRNRYTTIEAVNEAWNLDFWGHNIYKWEEIVLPSILTEAINYEDTAFAGISIDYRRFMSDSLLNLYKMERNIIREFDKITPITTNLMGMYKYIDYFKWAKEMDIISWDNYPAYNTKESLIAMTHDLMRGLKDGVAFMLMEQTPSQQNWSPYNSLKSPGKMRAQSYQAIAHGADTVQFFQLRRSKGGCEKFHGAVIAHTGHENTRVFREVAALGKELEGLNDLLGARCNNKVGIIFDWDNYWALEYTSGPTKDLKYVEQIHQYYKGFYDKNIPVDMISVDSEFTKYSVIVAPVLYMLKEGVAKKLEKFVENGGHLLTTFMSGLVNESDNIYLGGYPGPLRNLLGIWAEEIDALPLGHFNQIQFETGENYSCNLLCDIIHSEGAEVIATYKENFYAGTPAVTRNKYGKGTAWYVTTQIEEQGISHILEIMMKHTDVTGLIKENSKLEVVKREKGEREWAFIFNWMRKEQKLPDEFIGKKEVLSGKILSETDVLKLYDVMIAEMN